jgi:hypothetical protein
VHTLFPDEGFREVVFAGLNDYLADEAEHILAVIQSQENLDPPKPLAEAILHALKTDDRFKRHVLGRSESLNRGHA